MASASMKVATAKLILAPSMTLKGHVNFIGSISYFPDGQRMISGSYDRTVRQWDLKEGKEIEEVRDVCNEEVQAVAVSRDSRWVVTAGGIGNRWELKVCEKLVKDPKNGYRRQVYRTREELTQDLQTHTKNILPALD
ncbi:hypothetical protein P692DRAFT_20881920 [Suillus brevipes Sb2]|nr:hypothetical protein P692DRAFT_20881920 [Suillus brevipes Sb2]